MMSTMGDTPSHGMDLICRVMYDMQQDYFQYARDLGSGRPVSVPQFEVLIQKVRSYRADSLSPLPRHWYTLVSAPSHERYSRPEGGTPRDQAGATPAFNANADRRLLSRYRESPFNSISAMTKDKDVTIPKIGDKPVCLTWALKGACTTACRRKDAHVAYTRSVNQKLHELLDKCGVENAQA